MCGTTLAAAPLPDQFTGSARQCQIQARAMHNQLFAEPQGERRDQRRSEEHTSELQSLMRISYAVFCLKKKKHTKDTHSTNSYNPHTHTTLHDTKVQQL